ncbi:MAG: flavin reductase family protein [Pseudomonadota bacterium]
MDAMTGTRDIRLGASGDPAVLMLTGAATGWHDVADALADAGRYVIRIDTNSDEPADIAGDLAAVLADLPARPTLIADAGRAALAAETLRALPNAAAALVLVAPDAVPDLPDLPLLVVQGAGMAGAAASDAEETVVIADAAALPGDGEALNAVLLEFLERQVPRTPPAYQTGSDSRTLRDALGCFATGVTVVTTLAEDGTPVGLTANSFTSVSLDPPLLLVCVAKSASSLTAFEAADAFAVNVLQIGQQPVSSRFATRGQDKFAGTRTERWSTGVPIIADSLASFECTRHALHDGGDHLILVGRVGRVRFEPRRDPLLYFRGKYRRLHFA